MAAPDHLDAADSEWDTAEEVKVTLSGRTASASGSTVKVDGSTITIGAPGTYLLPGRLDDGQVVVDSPADGIVRLVLDGADITSSTTSAITVMKADEAMVVLADGSTNRLVDAARYVFPSADVDEPNAAPYSAADLTIAGKGSLTVDGNFNDAIASQDGLVLSDGTLTLDAVDDGVRGKDS
ncbi:MAG: carbohydrate-binding domain-containing protein [Acidimicrobiales bacterium]